MQKGTNQTETIVIGIDYDESAPDPQTTYAGIYVYVGESDETQTVNTSDPYADFRTVMAEFVTGDNFYAASSFDDFWHDCYLPRPAGI